MKTTLSASMLACLLTLFLNACGKQDISTHTAVPPGEEIQIPDDDSETKNQIGTEDTASTADATAAPDAPPTPEGPTTVAHQPPPQTSTQPVVTPTATPTPAPAGSVNRKLFDYYSQSANYQKVYNNVMGWYGTLSNACVAFMSTALRQIGVDVPQNGKLGGESISLVTLPFSRHLQEKLGWIKITKAADLQPGDVVFTVDAPGWPGYPWHTYMFHSWVNKTEGTGKVIDNQGFTHNRNIFGYGSYNFSPFAYALRSPK